MHKSTRGFTIVELLIVIVVIAILAAISIVAYNGIQARAKTSVSTSTASNVIKKIELYKSIHSVYPTYAELKNNYAPGATVAGGGGFETKLDNPNSIVSAGLGATTSTNGSIVQYNDCVSSTQKSIVYYNYQTNSAANMRIFETC